MQLLLLFLYFTLFCGGAGNNRKAKTTMGGKASGDGDASVGGGRFTQLLLLLVMLPVGLFFCVSVWATRHPAMTGHIPMWHNFISHGYSFDEIPNLGGKVAIVTGANGGIGFQTAKQLALKGAHVVAACRSAKKCKAVTDEIRASAGDDKVQIEAMTLDLASFVSVRAFAHEFRKKIGRSKGLHMLVLNAGVMHPPHTITQDGLELQFQVNHASHQVLTTELLDLLELSAPSRVVVVSSVSHETTITGHVMVDKDTLNDAAAYNANKWYSNSKLCNVLFAQELSSRLAAKGKNNVYVNALNPGWVHTNLIRHDVDRFNALPPGVRHAALTAFRILERLVAWDPKTGALTPLWAATSPEVESLDIRGQYLVPIARISTPCAFESGGRCHDDAKALWNFTEEVSTVLTTFAARVRAFKRAAEARIRAAAARIEHSKTSSKTEL